MKRIAIIIIALFLFIPFYGCSSNNQAGNYVPFPGKDTILDIGDARFEVFKNSDKEKPYGLYDRKNTCGIDFITKYSDISPYFYAIGKKGYTKVSYQLGVYYTSQKLETFDESDQAIFKLLENSSDTIKSYKDHHNKIQRNNDEVGPLAYLDDKGLYAIYEKKIDNYRQYELTDRKNNKAVDYINKYKVFNSCIYSIGEQGYTKIDLSKDQNPYVHSWKLDSFNNDDQIVFKILKAEDSNFSELVKYQN